MWSHGFYWECEAETLEVAAEKILDAWQKACKFYLYDRYDGMPIDDRSILASWEIEMFPVYKLLMGYALENIIKGIIICQMSINDPHSIEKENFEDLKFTLKGGGYCGIKVHGLVNKLLNAEVVNIVVLDKEKPLLKDLDACVLWGGKYPVPRNNKSNEAFIIPMGGVVELKPELAKPIKAIYDKWHDELRRIIRTQ